MTCEEVVRIRKNYIYTLIYPIMKYTYNGKEYESMSKQSMQEEEYNNRKLCAEAESIIYINPNKPSDFKFSNEYYQEFKRILYGVVWVVIGIVINF